jgi:SPP1 gp7 family putative phage head morphogenesis protein
MVDVNGSVYQELMKQRELFRIYGINYKEMKWATEVLERLEQKTAYDYYTEQDHQELYKARKIIYTAHLNLKSNGDETTDNHTTTHYIWRTQGDNKTRPSHAANNGKTFSWDNPPPTGNPGQAYGCRCWAEPFDPEDGESRIEFRNQIVTSFQLSISESWTTYDYTQHYRNGGGRPVTLSETGQLQNVIVYVSTYPQPKGGTIFDRFASNLFEKARQQGVGSFSLGFNANYNMIGIVTSFRTVIVEGMATVNVEDRGKFLIIHADIDYSFKDRYTDPTDWQDHSKEPRGSDAIRDDYGIPYDITDTWGAVLTAMIKKDSSQSKYPDDEFGR